MEKVAASKGEMYRTAQAQAVLAMAQQQLGKTNQARETLAKALELVDTRFPKAGKGALDDQWNDWITAHAFLREAKALVHGASAGADK